MSKRSVEWKKGRLFILLLLLLLLLSGWCKLTFCRGGEEKQSSEEDQKRRRRCVFEYSLSLHRCLLYFLQHCCCPVLVSSLLSSSSSRQSHSPFVPLLQLRKSERGTTAYTYNSSTSLSVMFSCCCSPTQTFVRTENPHYLCDISS